MQYCFTSKMTSLETRAGYPLTDMAHTSGARMFSSVLPTESIGTLPSVRLSIDVFESQKKIWLLPMDTGSIRNSGHGPHYLAQRIFSLRILSTGPISKQLIKEHFIEL